MLPSNISTPAHIKNTCNEQDIASVLCFYIYIPHLHNLKLHQLTPKTSTLKLHQRVLFTGFLENSCSVTFHKFHRKALVMEFF